MAAEPGPRRAAESGPAAGPAQPAFEVVAGHPTAEEVAAVTLALAAKLAGSSQPRPPRLRGSWADWSRTLRLPISPGPGAWRRSALP